VDRGRHGVAPMAFWFLSAASSRTRTLMRSRFCRSQSRGDELDRGR
jgi:hypothetical protein